MEHEEWDGPDTDRPLTERGVKRVSQVAAGLRWLEVQPTYIFSSPLVRALETADILLASMSIPSAIKRVDELFKRRGRCSATSTGPLVLNVSRHCT